MNYVIIGNAAAAVGTIEGIREVDKTGKITVISEENYHTYSRPLISYWLMGKVTDKNIYYRSPDFYEKNGVETMLGCRAVKIDTAAKSVVLSDGNTVPYDKLMVATGSKPFVPPMNGMEKIASLARSVVGRVSLPSSVRRCVPLAFPVMIRIMSRFPPVRRRTLPSCRSSVRPRENAPKPLVRSPR